VAQRNQRDWAIPETGKMPVQRTILSVNHRRNDAQGGRGRQRNKKDKENLKITKQTEGNNVATDFCSCLYSTERRTFFFLTPGLC
jgi:hypothetical protein